MKTTQKQVDYDKFSQLTEGYKIADLVQLVERAVFYAHRNGIYFYFVFINNV